MNTLTQTTTADTPLFLNCLSRRERLLWLRELDAATPCGSLLVLSIVELNQPAAGLYSLTPSELEAYFASGYEILPLSQTPCHEGVEYRFLLKKHNSLDPSLVAQALSQLRAH
ncbi:hypothetical protein [Armatimonas rosea]|uniref:Uncharacterized protein n=1 Tax=Armatimonas rosea TaxID=685828 RepID=A0A7W9SKT4_ARMRO|nr:hypothetical protein [Armatimonas rosea]MBB6048472.1 hypothetical protein [Armatimonas rosea]